MWRVHDEDDGIKASVHSRSASCPPLTANRLPLQDLAVEAIEDLWFTQSFAKTGSRPSKFDKKDGGNEELAPGIARLARIIMTVTGVSKDRPPPVEEVLRSVSCPTSTLRSLTDRKHLTRSSRNMRRKGLNHLPHAYVWLLNLSLTAWSRMMAQWSVFPASRPFQFAHPVSPSQNLVSCIKTIYILSSTDPLLLSTAKASILLPFLKSATTVRVLPSFLANAP